MGRVGGEQVLGYHDRAYDGDPHTMAVPGARVEVVTPWEEVRLWADPDTSAIGVDLVFRARTRPYGLRRGTMRAGDDLVWDQCHILQSGTYSGTYTVGGQVHEVDGWIGQRDHSWGIRDHGRCPLWLWFQIQLDDGFLGVWHWELADGAPVYTDGCWAGAGRQRPCRRSSASSTTSTGSGTGPDMTSVDAAGAPAAYGEHGEAVAGLAGHVPLHAGRRARHRGRGRGHVRPALRAVPPRRAQPHDRSAPATVARAPPSTRSPAPATTASSPTPSSTGMLPS